MLQDLEVRSLLSGVSAGADPYQPTADEQYMLELINQARANPAAEGQRLLSIAQTDPVIRAATASWDLNQFVQVISSYGPLPPLAFNTGLIEAARDHDAAMLADNSQFHSPTGYLNNPGVATDAGGQAYYPTGSTGWATGENIFAYSANVPAGSSTSAYVDYFNEAFFLDWGNPDFGHLKNLLAPGPAEAGPGSYPFSEIGIGLLTGVAPTSAPDASNPIAANRGLNVGPDLVTQEFGWRSGDALLTGVVYRDGDNNNFYTPGEGLGGVTIQAIGQGGQGTFQTQTWASGGYSLPLPPGTYTVNATGGNLPAPQTTTITIGRDNVPWDVQLNGATAAAALTTGAAEADQPVPGSYLGAGEAIPAVYRPGTSQWFLAGQDQPISFGAPNLDVPLPGNYDGIGHAEIAVYRPTTSQWFIAGHASPINFGAPGLDIPVPGDYDGTGHTEIAVYRPTTGQWFIAGHASPINFGAPGLDIPVPGDYDGTGHTELAVYRPTTGQWFIAGHASPISFGAPGLDIPVSGDYDGTGHTEPAVYRPSTGQWFIAGHAQGISFGAADLDVPVRGDFDGDGRTDPAVFRPTTGQWFILGSSAGVEVQQFGQGGASPPIDGWLAANPLSPGSALTQLAVAADAHDASTGTTPSPTPTTSPGTNPAPIRHPRGPLALSHGRSRLTVHAPISGHGHGPHRLARGQAQRLRPDSLRD